MEPQILYFLMYLGLFANFLLPYLRKIHEGSIDKLDPKYLWHLAITASWQFVIMFPIYTQWTVPTGFVGDLAIMILVIAFGFGGPGMQKEAEKYILAYRKT